MITKLSKALVFNKNLFTFASQPHAAVMKPKLMAPKPPQLKPKIGELSLAIVSQQLNINE